MSGFPNTWTGSQFKHDIPTRKRLKSKKDRDEAKVKKAVRAECVERDGYCLVGKLGVLGCKGRSTWAHLSGHRRSQTRGMPPTIRHNTMWTAMLCERHHSQEERNKFRVVYRTVEYANGPVTWEPVNESSQPGDRRYRNVGVGVAGVTREDSRLTGEL